MLLAHTTHIILLLLAPLTLGETTLELTNTQTIIDEQDALTDVTPVSFGIKSFTVEVMKPTTKPALNTSQLDESARIAAVVEDSMKFDKSQPNHLSTADNIERFQTTELSPSTEFRDGEATITPTEPVMLPSDLNGKSEITFIEQENTDERPPDSSSSIFSSVTVITSSPTLDSGGKTEEPMINDIHVERQLENGLYRIKLAEIITDEFNNGAGANLNPSSDRKERNQLQMKSTGGKINIIDLYPSKLEDFGPMIKESNEKMLKDRDMYLRDDDDKNSLPNSLSGLFEDDSNIPTSKIEIELIDENDNSQRSTDMLAKITDITGKLQQQDGVITEIEKKFRLDELKQSTPKTVTVNHKIDFIDRRVKKSFDYPPTSQFARFGTFGRIDFANTKFNTDSTKRDTNREMEHNDRPEFSTTKFYNSKELYNEMLHKKLTADILGAGDGRIATLSQPLTTIKPNISVNSANINDNRTSPLRDITTEEIQRRDEKSTVVVTSTTLSDSKPSHYIGDVSTTAHTTPKPLKKTKALPRSTTKSIRASTADTPSSMVLKAIKATTIPPATLTTNEVAKESTTLKEVAEKQETTFPEYVNVAGMSTQEQTSPTTVTTSFSKITEDITTNSHPAGTAAAAAASSVAGSMAKTRKPFSRPRVLTRLQEKINSLECDIQNLPQDSHIWRGNETHELLLPITIPKNCITAQDCLPMIISWEGQAEIQSGDVLLVEINDALLTPAEINEDSRNNTHKAATRVYQVTRPGHEHCDVTEGVLLDITPLVVDGKKLVTLYDKDLTEGINLLIVVSDLWGSQCVRLKVTVKSDNCGENADCSGKGVCFSNISMEGYECQCCSGFAGPHCEEIDACSPSPCTNNGICVDLSQGHEGNAYQCLCPYGYTGKNCQYESDPCNPAECMNGGSCVGNSTHFRCDCAPGYTGPLCQHNLNECESSPCVHGICVDQEDGFRCFCQPGFAGELCNFEYNECESNPCLNGGECIDQIGSFECKCTKGYTGNQCHIKVDFCANGPCPEGHRCTDHGDDFTCECPGGRNGPDCNQVPRTLCNVNPCANGGTCWTSEDSFYCACRPGYTGKMCEDEFVVETVVSSSEFMVDDANAGNAFSEKSFGSAVSKSPIELHNAYIAAGTLAAAIFIVAVVVTICHCKVHQTYRKFSTRHHQLIPIFGFGKRIKSPKSNRHWLSGKGGGGGGVGGGGSIGSGGGNVIGTKANKGHLPGTGVNQCHNHHIGGSTLHHQQQQQQQPHQVHDRPFQRHLAMNLENDMYYTVDFSDSQHSPLIQ